MFNREKAIKCYSTSDKYYHTIYHIERMIKGLGDNLNGFLQEFPDLSIDLLLDMIYYHDCVYIVGSKEGESERKSADYFEEINGLGKEQFIVSNAILSTIPTKYEYKNMYEKVLHDLDWITFGERSEFLDAGKRIRKEALDNTKSSFREILQNQRKFYSWLLKRNEPIFVTQTMSKNDKNQDVFNNIQIIIKKIDKVLADSLINQNFDNYTLERFYEGGMFLS